MITTTKHLLTNTINCVREHLIDDAMNNLINHMYVNKNISDYDCKMKVIRGIRNAMYIIDTSENIDTKCLALQTLSIYHEPINITKYSLSSEVHKHYRNKPAINPPTGKTRELIEIFNHTPMITLQLMQYFNLP